VTGTPPLHPGCRPRRGTVPSTRRSGAVRGGRARRPAIMAARLSRPYSLMRRHIWLSCARVWPLRGWHVQQLRRIALAERPTRTSSSICDSDVIFVRSFDADQLSGQDGAACFAATDGLGRMPPDPSPWVANAGHALASIVPVPPHDYIATLIAWRRKRSSACAAISKELHGRHWAAVIAARRRFSECILYGRYVDEVLSRASRTYAREERLPVMWNGRAPDDAELLPVSRQGWSRIRSPWHPVFHRCGRQTGCAVFSRAAD
jgi:hypothetical protein